MLNYVIMMNCLIFQSRNRGKKFSSYSLEYLFSEKWKRLLADLEKFPVAFASDEIALAKPTT